MLENELASPNCYLIMMFRAHLEPMAEIPAHELWLYKNPQAPKDVQEGLQQSKEGKLRKRGSSAKHAQDEILSNIH